MFSKGVISEERLHYRGKRKTGTFEAKIYWNGEVYGKRKAVYFQVKPSHRQFELNIGVDKDGLIKGATPNVQQIYALNADIFNRLYHQIVVG